MKMVYEFTEAERRVIAQAQASYLQVVKVIAELHSLDGQLTVSPDLRGFISAVASPPEQASQSHAIPGE
jgi:hypothetical protein